MIFRISNLRKPMKNRYQNVFEKTSPKNLLKATFCVHLGLPKPLKIAPKTIEIPSRSDAERSLLRDAMQLANKSLEVNGAASFVERPNG